MKRSSTKSVFHKADVARTHRLSTKLKDRLLSGDGDVSSEPGGLLFLHLVSCSKSQTSQCPPAEATTSTTAMDVEQPAVEEESEAPAGAEGTDGHSGKKISTSGVRLSNKQQWRLSKGLKLGKSGHGNGTVFVKGKGRRKTGRDGRVKP